jgi:hypothetical protein
VRCDHRQKPDSQEATGSGLRNGIGRHVQNAAALEIQRIADLRADPDPDVVVSMHLSFGPHFVGDLQQVVGLERGQEQDISEGGGRQTPHAAVSAEHMVDVNQGRTARRRIDIETAVRRDQPEGEPVLGDVNIC